MHLHLHSQSSYLDGFGSAKNYTKRAAELGFEYLAVTDHGNIDAAIDWQEECEKEKIKPIIGSELYVVSDMQKKDKNENRGHLTALVYNINGWRTLCRWLTKANQEGFYHRPRCDYELILNSDLDGLIFGTACAGSVIMKPGGDRFIHDLADKAGLDNVFIEIMPHDIKAQHILHEKIKKDYRDWPLIATNDAHYILEEDWEVQEVLLAIQRNVKWNDKNRWRFGFTGLHLRTADEMILAFRKQNDFDRKTTREALERTVDIAQRCADFKIEKQEICLPELPYKISERTEFDELKKSCTIAMREFGYHKKTEYQKRLEEELDLIKRKNFSRYFLLVQDFITACKSKGWAIGPGRGSVGGSLIAHLLKITDKELDPIKYNLPFSRFLSENRVDWPDIDIDVEKRFRQQAVDMLFETYGENHVAYISTESRLRSRGVIRDLGRIFEIPTAEVSSIANAIFEKDHEESSAIEEAIEKNSDAAAFAKKYPKIIKLALKLEGQYRGTGKHAAGIVVEGTDLTSGQKCVLKKDYVVNWNMKSCEKQGLMKLDVLGLATLSVIEEAIALIKEKDPQFDIHNIPKNDREALKLIDEGNTVGIFQVSARPLTELCIQMKIEDFEHINAAIALIRPGPSESGMTDEYVRRQHGEQWEKEHPIYEEITKDTYGKLVYQEQVILVLSRMAGMSEADADSVRRVIGKKRDPKEFEPYKKQFIEGCLKQKTYNAKEAEEFWEGLLHWSRYGFGRAHSTAYALIAYRTAYLKAHYPVEFICATLTYGEYNEKSRDPHKHKDFMIQVAKDIGLAVLPPKVGLSDATRWRAQDDKLYAPFIELKSFGESNAEKAVQWRPPTKPKNMGFFKKQSEKQKPKLTKIDEILLAIKANEPDEIPEEADEYLSFKCGLGARKKRIPKREMQLVKAKQIKYRNERIPKCRRCSLRDEATEPVPSSMGRYNIFIIGEAPGANEDKGITMRNGSINRMGFIGKAGDLLWDALKEHGIQRADVHVANICRCFPSKTRTPKAEHIEKCFPWLESELKKTDCKLILACGNICLKAFTDRDGGIMSMSGKREWVERVNAWVVWCIHPSAVLRNPSNRDAFDKGVKEFAKCFQEVTK